ncbi:methyl-CpG-binding domain protein 2-like, partial [Camarhynchus parvulus]|uniref:methyl-CpG-binding domain protein 2-like n=1 Tax=Geospiza parvula TaxID=87175 RepID=UPI001237BED0
PKQKLPNDALNPNKGKPDLNTTLPIRQTASIFKQPVTKVTNHPGNKVRSDPQRLSEQPRQLFWEKRLQGLSASDVSEQIIKSMELPKGLQGGVPKIRKFGPKNGKIWSEKSQNLAPKIRKFGSKNAKIWSGPEVSGSRCCRNVATFCTKQLGRITARPNVPAVWLNTAQPLCRHLVVTDDDIRKQEERVQAVRKKLEEALLAEVLSRSCERRESPERDGENGHGH